MKYKVCIFKLCVHLLPLWGLDGSRFSTTGWLSSLQGAADSDWKDKWHILSVNFYTISRKLLTKKNNSILFAINMTARIQFEYYCCLPRKYLIIKKFLAGVLSLICIRWNIIIRNYDHLLKYMKYKWNKRGVLHTFSLLSGGLVNALSTDFAQ